MPPIRSEKKQDSIYQEGRISLVIKAIQNKSIASVAAAATRAYNVPRSTLRDRVNGALSQTTLRVNGHKLTQIDKDILVKWIISMDNRGAAPRPPIVRTIANILLAATGNNIVGKYWVTNFIKRTLAIQTRFSRRYNYSRALQEDPRILRE